MRALRSHKNLRDDYLRLVQRCPLRRLRNDSEYRRAVNMMMPLMGRDNSLSDGESDYLSSLIVLIADYERQRWPIDLSQVTPLRALKHLMGEKGMTRADLAHLLGSSAASMILQGKRELSKNQIRTLSQHFKVS